jgi:CRISPR-associated protein Cmr2
MKSDLTKSDLWERILSLLNDEGYVWPPEAELEKLDRPNDFNEFRQFAEASKDYIGLIYADANNMGKMMEHLEALRDREAFAKGVDGAIHKAIAHAINKFLPIVTIEREEKLKKEKEKVPVFPFDLLLVGGDDIVMITDATKAMEVACVMAQQFRALANDPQTFKNKGQISEHIRDLLQKGRMSLSISVVLAPVKYPFGLLQDMAESALKFAKKAAHDDRAKLKEEDQKQFDGSRINFFVVTGGSKPDFKDIYKDLYYKRTGDDQSLEFHATLRPYTPEELQTLLEAIRARKNLGRTKLHQLREAVYDKNLSTSVMKARAALRSWGESQWDHIVTRVVYGQSREYKKHRYKMSDDDANPQNLLAAFPHVIFPWFADGENKVGSKRYEVYRTPLLDFIELYDFVAREGGNNDGKV